MICSIESECDERKGIQTKGEREEAKKKGILIEYLLAPLVTTRAVVL